MKADVMRDYLLRRSGGVISPRPLCAYSHDFAMLDRADDPSARLHMRQQVLNAVRLGADN